MLAYKSTIHETTGFLPNSFVLRREVCTSLDIVYDVHVPSAIKPECVWQKQARLEYAHTTVWANKETLL